MADSQINLTYQDDIAILTLDVKGERVNTLGPAMTERMEAILDELEAKSGLTAAVIESAKDDFIVGFDIKELKRFNEDPGGLRELVDRGHALMARFESLGIPFVAALHGNCLGGGLEVAVASHRTTNGRSWGCPKFSSVCIRERAAHNVFRGSSTCRSRST